MIGSSIFEFWEIPKWDDLSITNQAIRSTTTDFWVNYDLSTLPNSKAILVYCGSNDLIFGNTTEQISFNLQGLMSKLSRQFPGAKIGYFSILQCPQKSATGQSLTIDHINQYMRAESGQYYQYFEFNEAIDQQPKWFIEDGLHLTQEAYAMLNVFYSQVIQVWTVS